jgi:hypothetical protein
MRSAEEVASRVCKALIKRRRHLVLTFYQGKLTILIAKIFPKLVDSQVYKTFAKEPDSPLK